jgi:hypothetical protein
MRNLTPKACLAGSCPAVFERPDGRLVIIGGRAGTADLTEIEAQGAIVGYNEYAIVIEPALLATVDRFPSNPEAPGPYEDFDPLYVKPRQELELP